jgi:hypothetical protein
MGNWYFDICTRAAQFNNNFYVCFSFIYYYFHNHHKKNPILWMRKKKQHKKRQTQSLHWNYIFSFGNYFSFMEKNKIFSYGFWWFSEIRWLSSTQITRSGQGTPEKKFIGIPRSISENMSEFFLEYVGKFPRNFS